MERFKKFAEDLEAIARKHGIGIEGELSLTIEHQTHAKLYVQHNSNPENKFVKKLSVDL